MRKLILLIVSTLIVNLSLSQNKLGNEWITGGGGQRIVFSTNTINTNKNFFILTVFSSGSSSICDTNGNLILASDGYNIYNGIGGGFLEGDSIIPKDYFIAHSGFSIASQTSIFLPMDSDKYYFVTPTMGNTRYADCQANNNCYFDLLLYNVIDMKANAGAGMVTQRMKPLMQNANLRKTQMMACRHGNGKDWWLLKNEGDSANVHTFLFTQDSVYDKGVQVFNEPVWGQWDIRGMSTFNTDGSMFATTSHALGSGQIMLADFDRCYGILSNPRVLQMPTNSQQNPSDLSLTESLSVGLAFSPNKRFLYVASICNIYQYDLQDNTWFHVAGIDTAYLEFQKYATAYLAPDNKIYFGNYGGGSRQMSRIDNPDVKGAGCNFCPRCLRLDSLGANAYVGTPPCMPNYGLGAKTCWPLNQSESVKAESEWSVYPNPANQTIIIKNSKGKQKVMYDALGQIIQTTTDDQMNVSSLAKGLYYIRCDNKTKKVLIE